MVLFKFSLRCIHKRKKYKQKPVSLINHRRLPCLKIIPTTLHKLKKNTYYNIWNIQYVICVHIVICAYYKKYQRKRTHVETRRFFPSNTNFPSNIAAKTTRHLSTADYITHIETIQPLSKIILWSCQAIVW